MSETATLDSPALWVAAVGVVATAVASVVAFLQYRADVKGREVLSWQKSTIHRIFQQSAADLSFDDLKTKYRSLAADHMQGLLKSRDISDANLRLVLIDLCKDQVIVQGGEDRYTLSKYQSYMQELQKVALGNQDVNQKLLDLQKQFFEAQLKALSDSNENIRRMIQQNERLSSGRTGG